VDGGLGLEGGLALAVLVLGSPGGSSWVEGGFGLAGWIGMGSVGAGVSWWE